jgi:hypothetical protein
MTVMEYARKNLVHIAVSKALTDGVHSIRERIGEEFTYKYIELGRVSVNNGNIDIMSCDTVACHPDYDRVYVVTY